MTSLFRFRLTPIAAAMTFALTLMVAVPAQAGLFDDDQARQAILELREKINSFQATTVDRFEKNNQATLDLQNQLNQLKDDNAQLRGQNEALQNDLAKLQRSQLEGYRELDERIKKTEPKLMMVEGREGLVDVAEQKDYEQALKVLRDNDMKTAVTRFQSFVQRYPSSVYLPLAEFWLGSALYSQRDCKNALITLQDMVKKFSAHPKVPDALSVIGNCQAELGQKGPAKKTFEMIVSKYPSTDAAALAKQRLTQLK